MSPQYEHRSEPVLPRQKFVYRLWRHFLATLALNHGNKADAIARLETFVASANPNSPNLENAKALLLALKK